MEYYMRSPVSYFLDVLCVGIVPYPVPGPQKVTKKNHTDLIPQKAHNSVGP